MFAIILTYCRAAWISLMIAAVVFLLIITRIRFQTVLVILCITGAILFQNRSGILVNLQQNKQGSSMKLDEQIQSISNVETDMSNKERLNRWKSAFRMFEERPVFGWGPGSYSFEYAPFQLSQDRTTISTNLGDRGNAHSDYIGSLADSGLLGCLSFILIVIVTLYAGIKLYRKVIDQRQTRIWVMCAILGLVTYYTHATLNNFLDTDKDSALFWGFTAMIVAIDIYQVRGKQEKIRKSESQAL
jgi:O-antigen ligase